MNTVGIQCRLHALFGNLHNTSLQILHQLWLQRTVREPHPPDRLLPP